MPIITFKNAIRFPQIILLSKPTTAEEIFASVGVMCTITGREILVYLQMQQPGIAAGLT